MCAGNLDEIKNYKATNKGMLRGFKFENKEGK